MSVTTVLIVVAAVLAFWMLGAYNRLVGLRNVITTAWTQFDEQLRRRGDALAALLAALHGHLPHEHRHALEAADAARRQVQAAADTLRARPLQAAGAASLVAAEGVLGSAFERVSALIVEHATLRTEAAVEQALREQQEVDLRLMLARQLVNDAVDAYNSAARQFPTTFVARVFGLRRAGRV